MGLQWYQLAHLVEAVFKNIRCPSVWRQKSISVNEVVFLLMLAVCKYRTWYNESWEKRGALHQENQCLTLNKTCQSQLWGIRGKFWGKESGRRA